MHTFIANNRQALIQRCADPACWRGPGGRYPRNGRQRDSAWHGTPSTWIHDRPVVHDYGDLCQAVTDLAIERDAPFSIKEFRTLNRSLDNSISFAVTEFSAARDRLVASKRAAELKESLGFPVHELRNGLSTAMLA